MNLVESGDEPTHGLTEFGPFWPRYDARVVEGMLVFATKADDEGFLPEVDTRVTRRRPGRRFSPMLLDRFMQLPLARDPSGATATFASRYGRLGLCRHGLPNRHQHRAIQFRAEGDCWDLSGPEPLEAWLYWARRAKAMLELADTLKGWRDRRTGELAARRLVSEDQPYPAGRFWDVLRSTHEQLAEMWTCQRRPGVRPAFTHRHRWPRILGGAVERWAQLAGVEYAITWRGGVIEPDLRYSDLFGLLGVQTLRRIASNRPDRRVTEVLYCQAPDCGVEFERWQPHGRARYCRGCSEDGVAQHVAEERYRAKRKEESRRDVGDSTPALPVQQAAHWGTLPPVTIRVTPGSRRGDEPARGPR